MKKFAIVLKYLLISSLAFSLNAQAEEGERFLTFTFENDAFVGSDDGYTNGTGLTIGRSEFSQFSDANTPRWIQALTKNLYITTMEGKKRGISHMFFQRMQTPEDITDPNFISNDVPYAGLLAWQGTMYAWDEKVSDQVSLFLGLIGPAAGGKVTQKAVHDLIGADDPRGWQFQLRNEPVFKVEFQRLWTLYRNRRPGLQFDVLGLGGFGVGNLESAARGGIALRFGTNLSDSSGTFSLQADRHVNPLAFTRKNCWFVFIGARAGYVANDILIDGNTFKDSHSLELEHFQNEVSAGLVWSFNRWAFVFQLTSFSSRTTQIDEREKYGAVSVTYRF